ncbi:MULTISPECIES: phasin family protein [Bacillus]|mgnify:CR=1 FL=1|jgi:polyhydroxyalkanoate synthesis regulator phasin|uniref:Poly(Hydroxyalcanoate) granule associated protein (Phasin) n=2 Tax=Bacillus cereus group TaxID=86661 RepID=A0A1J9Y5W3_9BACI|nr:MULTISPECIES: phasin family protein [Bacillus]AAS43800.1 ATP synthase B chain [imported], putative [Bacillus cereus ATCC 10987]AFQ10180.1 ATP synthase subunit B [Bacillus cereus FRI-35]AIE81313.1 ATP synthase subunit B [Bacillus cereus]KMQ28913.1 ATP synthase subunit B [Bacillus cereus]KXY74884.1 ATP synthase subunit B [Bacillus cereus]
MTNIIKKGLALGLGMIATTQEQAKKIADELVKRGELSQEESKEFVKEMYEKGKETKLELEQLINTKTKEVLGELNLATKEDIQRLEQRIANIENQKNKLE